MSSVALRRFFNKKCVLITGCGTLGCELTRQLLRYPVHSIRLLDSSERALFRIRNQYGKVRLLLGDIRDRSRMELAMSGVDYVIHTAAVKSVDIASENPIETISVNVSGTLNVVEVAMKAEVKKVLALSSDKSILNEESGVYHASKYVLEQVTRWANKHSNITRFSAIRPANYVSGLDDMSVFETWRRKWENHEPVPVTDLNAKRFFIPLTLAARYCIRALTVMHGGEVFIPPAREFRMLDLAKKLKVGYQVIGLREGDRLTESLMSKQEIGRARRKAGMWVV